MSTYTMLPIGDYREEGWTLTGSGVTELSDAWFAVGDDTKYASNPSNKGRAAVAFEQDINSSNIADGSLIESVTIMLRAEATDAVARSVTVNLMADDNTASFNTRTIPLTTSPTTVEVATYTVDARGYSWSKERLNNVLLQVFSYETTANKVRVYSAYLVVNYSVKPSVNVTAPSGVVDSTAPTIAWDYSQLDGDTQSVAQYKVFTAQQVATPYFDAYNTPPLYPASTTYRVQPGDTLWGIAAKKLGEGTLWPTIYAISPLQSGDPNALTPGEIINIPGNSEVSGDIYSLTLPFSLSQNDYYIYVRSLSTRGVWSDWSSSSFTVAGGVPGAPGGSLGGAGTGGGGGFESVIGDSTTSNAYLTLRDGSNLLGAQQADFETLSDSNEYTATNAALIQDTTLSYGTGGASLKLTAASAATMSAQTSFTEVAPSTAVTARVQYRAAATARTVHTKVTFWDANFVTVAGTLSATGADATNTWNEVIVTGQVPAGAIYAQVVAEVVGAANAEVHNIDHVGLMYGTNAAWSSGGHASRNLLTSAQSTADDPIAFEPYAPILSSTYSRVTTTGTGSDGAKAFKMTYAGATPTISYVATGTAYTDATAGSTFTLNKPAGVANGDVLVAYVASDGGSVIPPSGWSVVSTDTATSVNLTVLMRDGLAADPSTWTGSFVTPVTRKRAFVVAYRGAATVANQFAVRGIKDGLLYGGLVCPTPGLYNPNGTAWRLSAFAAADNVSGGTMTANLFPPFGELPLVFYVGKATADKDTGIDTSFTINRPPNVITNDLMIASVAIAGNVTVTAPTGWTLVRQMQQVIGDGSPNSGSNTLAVMKRTATVTEPTAWVGSHTATGAPKVTQCSAYRYCDMDTSQFIDENGGTSLTPTFNTPTVTNTSSAAWRVCVFANISGGGSTMTTNETSERSDDTNSGSYPSVNLGMYDSNGTISTGPQTRTAAASNTSALYSSASWIGILKPMTSAASIANDTERQDATAGTGSLYVTLAGYDSNQSAAADWQAMYGTFTPGSGTTALGAVGFQGFLVPPPADPTAFPSISGEVGAVLASYVDLSHISSDVIARDGNQITVQAAFLGSTAGTAHLKLHAYSGVDPLGTQIAESAPFNTSVWTKASARFVLPPGTTRVKIGLSSFDRTVADYVLFDRVSAALGGDPTYRIGTGSNAHPIFDAPIVEYAEDLGAGYGDWAPLPGVGTTLKYDNLTGLCTIVDQTIVPLSSRKYRAQTISYGLAGDTFLSPYGPESEEVQLIADEWWLKDMLSPDLSMQLKVYADPLDVTTTDTSAMFQPLGSDLPQILTDGYKGDVIKLTVQVRKQDYLLLRQLFDKRHTMYLQSNLDSAWWVRPYGNLESTVQLTGDMHSDPLRFLQVSFVQVDPEV